MADNIKLKIETDGKQSIKTINQLEEELEQLNNEIKDVEVNSDAFKQLQKQIKSTDSQLKTLDESLEGLSTEQAVSEFGALTGGISAAFTGIATLSGEANESMEKMIKTVAQGMAIAEGFRGAAEAANAATKLWTKAQGFLNKAVRMFGKIGVVAIIGAVVTAITLLVGWLKRTKKETDAATESQKRFKAALGEVSEEIGFKLLNNFDAMLQGQKLVAEDMKNVATSFKDTRTEMEIFADFLDSMSRNNIQSMILSLEALIESQDRNRLKSESVRKEYDKRVKMLEMLKERVKEFGEVQEDESKLTDMYIHQQEYVNNLLTQYASKLKLVKDEIDDEPILPDVDVPDSLDDPFIQTLLNIQEFANSAIEETSEFQLNVMENTIARLQEFRDMGLITEEQYVEGIKKAEENITQILDDETQKQQNIINKQIELTKTSLGTISQVIGAAMGMFEQESTEFKMLSIAQGTVNVLLAATQALSNWKSLSPIQKIIEMGSILTAGFGLIGQMRNVEFERGGVLTGPSHIQGGIPTQFGELEGGEGVINATSMTQPSLRNLASAANVAGGGRDFSTGDGSIKLSNESLVQLASAINDKKVYVVETDITETQNTVKVIENEAIL